MLAVDHVILAVPTLSEGIENFRSVSGISAQQGGSHPHLGTHNALLSLGSIAYLELIARNPHGGVAPEDILMGIGVIKQPQLVGWAINSRNIDESHQYFRQLGIDCGEIAEGSRITPDGLKKQWRSFWLQGFSESYPIVPFVIDWVTPSPAVTTPKGAILRSLRGEHPDPAIFQKLIDVPGLPFRIDPGLAPKLIAEINTPAGMISLA
jgi:hypothetical protein